MFDFANSSYTTVIVSVVYALYFQRVLVGAHAPPGRGEFWWGTSIAITNLIVVAAAPFLGAIADLSGQKKRFLFFSYMTCVLASALLYIPEPGQIHLAVAIVVVSNLGFSFGENFTASFLPEIAPREAMGRVSGYGWSLGYVGGLLALLACAPLMSQGFSLATADRLRWAGPITAMFFGLAGIPTFLLLKERGRPRALAPGESYLKIGLAEVRQTLGELGAFRQLARFLVVFFFYTCGLMVVVAFASSLAEREFGMNGKELLMLFLALNVSSGIGAFGFGLLQDRIGVKTTIIATLMLWTVILVAVYFCHSKLLFFGLGNIAGLAIGATQSASRSLVAILAPPEKSAQFFGFWGLFGKLAYAVGPFSYGLIVQASGSPRLGILMITGYFVVGLAGMTFVSVDRGQAEAEAYRMRTVAAPPA